MTRFHLTTNPGLGDLVLEELGMPGTVDPDGRAGHIHVEGEIGDRIGELRSIHRAVRVVAELDLPERAPLDAIRAWVAEQHAAIPELSEPDRSFRVTSKRVGTHPFTSEDVQRVAGAGVRDAAPHPVDLKRFDVELRCDVAHDRCTLGVQLTDRSFANRRRGPYSQRTSLRGNVAWALLTLARIEPTAVLDPFVGAGTILSEAGALWPQARLAGGDRLQRAVDGATENLQAEDLGARSTIRLHDARDLAASWPEATFDLVATNPPFGHRLGRGEDLGQLYEQLLHSVDRVATADARLVVLVHRRGAFNRALGRTDRWVTRHVRVIELGGLYVGVFVLGRP